ncbi:iron-sulfur cluster assembly accessory protein [Bacteriovorax sp. Seq25_V]|uniref:HesB/IscA family protein n=1 Tax=Bacteriovorax sp. Seq25_V TaxID=1201288 RepID=UPI00038A3A9E|nr:iron-sulfur cluster assembly accessory protein [Bacteriovorax sp. Seq25_V]EQC43272.1 iron-sulfur cluster assembly accessory protein [Bacteriovorax sp. Seq25_V]
MENIVNISEKAIAHITEIFEKESKSFETIGLRLGVVGGGCSGLSYKIDFSEKKDKDNEMKFGKLRVFIDPKSSIYLKGVELDYKDGLNGKGFVFVNPNATNTCGCGESFTV